MSGPWWHYHIWEIPNSFFLLLYEEACCSRRYSCMAAHKKGRATMVSRKRKAPQLLQRNRQGKSKASICESSSTSPLLANGYLSSICPFTIEYLPVTKQKKKRGKSSKGQPSYPTKIPPGYRLEDPISEGGTFPIAYAIRPLASWESLKKYKNFISKNTSFFL